MEESCFVSDCFPITVQLTFWCNWN